MKDLNPDPRGNPTRAEDVVMPVVLYVEDNPDNRQSAEVNLGKKFKMLFAANAREACNTLALMGKKIAVILMDIELQDSELNGIELTKLIRGLAPREKIPDYARGLPVFKTPIIFLTAYGQAYNQEQILQAGGNDFLEKPVDFVELMLAITKYNLSMQKSG